MSLKVKVINPVWNGNGLLKRKIAEYYVAEGRAEWAGRGSYCNANTGTMQDIDLLLLDLAHPKNQSAAGRAGEWADSLPRGGDALGPDRAWFQQPPTKAPAFGRAKQLVSRDNLLANPTKETICERCIDKDHGPMLRVIPKPRYTPKVSIGRYSSTLQAFPVGDARKKREQLEAAKAGGR